MSEATLNSMSAIEIALLLSAAYVHDLGMSLSSIERERLLSQAEFTDHLRSLTDVWHRLEITRGLIPSANESDRLKYELQVFQLQEVALSSYLRARHADRALYEKMLADLKNSAGRSDLFEHDHVSYESVLIDICESHNLDVGVLAETRGPYDARFPRDLPIGTYKANIQFCGALLRLADILDFDRERTPGILFESLGVAENDLPGASVTLMEWQKHMAVHTIDINTHDLVFSADCKHPAIEAAVGEFCRLIERELRDTLSILRNNPPDILASYSIALPSQVRTRIRPQGYVFHDLRMEVNQSAIMTLLMGEKLYSAPGAALRELLQNAIDACEVKMKLSHGPFEAEISVELEQSADGRKWIAVTDNGIGMDERVISQYLFRVGSSYYDSPEFKRLIGASSSTFTPISRFGIGIASTFMIGDRLEITTCNPLSPRCDTKQRTITVDATGGLAFVTEVPSGRQGTCVRIRLDRRNDEEAALQRMEIYLREVVARPSVPIKLGLATKTTLKPQRFYSLSDEAPNIAKERGVEFVSIDLGKFSQTLNGIVVIPFVKAGSTLNAPGKNAVFDKRTGIDPFRVFRSYKGNLLTVNGFRMGMRKANRVFGRKMRFAYDIEIIGDREVVFDVSRDRIIGNGISVVRTRLCDAIVLGLREMGVYERLTEDAKFYLTETAMSYGDLSREIDEQLLNAVAGRIPDGIWPIGIHKTIADELEISATLARATISLLLATDRIKDGRRAPIT
ncbi:MAG: ATP-binding protein [Pseudorhodoplanes sp.]